MTHDERIELLKDILLELHHGATPESVQDKFNQHFKGVSAIEISMMEHELMSGDHGVTFADVMKLCNVHANLFREHIDEVTLKDSDHLGHPVNLFKQENLAFQAAIGRIHRLYQSLMDTWDDEVVAGLNRQLKLLGQFKLHYDRKEQIFFPVMERYGHTAPPKVMWGVDDQIRDLYDCAVEATAMMTPSTLADAYQSFQTFVDEFEAMIFKEEQILLQILMETLNQDDWLQIRDDSEQMGYAIIHPEMRWEPERVDFEEVGTTANQTITLPDGGQITINYTPPTNAVPVDMESTLPFGHGHLTVKEANLILNHLPMEITFVNKDDIFQYYNAQVEEGPMIFPRNPSQIGRHVELCHPPRVVDQVRQIMDDLRTGKEKEVVRYFKRHDLGQFIYVSYKGVWDEDGIFQGVLETVQNIQPYRDIDEDMKLR